MLRSGLFGMAYSVWPILSGRFGQTMKSSRNRILMQSRVVSFNAHTLHHHTVGYQRSRHSTQSVLPSRLGIAPKLVSRRHVEQIHVKTFDATLVSRRHVEQIHEVIREMRTLPIERTENCRAGLKLKPETRERSGNQCRDWGCRLL